MPSICHDGQQEGLKIVVFGNRYPVPRCSRGSVAHWRFRFRTNLVGGFHLATGFKRCHSAGCTEGARQVDCHSTPRRPDRQSPVVPGPETRLLPPPSQCLSSEPPYTMAGQIHRVTLFKIPNHEDQERLLDFYKHMQSRAVKVSIPRRSTPLLSWCAIRGQCLDPSRSDTQNTAWQAVHHFGDRGRGKTRPARAGFHLCGHFSLQLRRRHGVL